MEKIDVLFIGFAIYVIITSCYIAYLKVGINFVIDKLAKHHTVLEKMLENIETQNKINNSQDEYNTAVRELLKVLVDGSPSTGGRKQSI